MVDYKEALTDKAVADYKEAIRLDPNYAAAYDALAWLRATDAHAVAPRRKGSRRKREEGLRTQRREELALPAHPCRRLCRIGRFPFRRGLRNESD